MMRTFSKLFALLSVTLQISGCGKTALSLFQSKPTSLVEDPDSLLADMQTRCGATLNELSDPEFVILSATYKSLPITTDGVKDGITYRVVTQAMSAILAKGGSNQVNISASVQSMSAKDASGTILTEAALDKVIRPRTATNIAANTGSLYNSSTPGSLILRLSRQEGPYKNMLCAASFITSQRDTLGGTTGEIKFDVPTPLSPNPRASLPTFETELGNGKVFNANVTITTAKAGWPQASTVIPIVITWRKVSTDINQSGQVPGQTLPSVKADLAYEVTITSTTVSPPSFGLSRRRVFYIDTATRMLSAIVDDSGKAQLGTENTTLPATVLIPQ